MANSNWTNEEILYLKERKAAGDSANVIAHDLHRTRGSIVRKAERLGLGVWKSTGRVVHAIKQRNREPDAVPPLSKEDHERLQQALAKAQQEKARRQDERIQTKPKPLPLSKGDLRRMFEDAWRNTAGAMQ